MTKVLLVGAYPGINYSASLSALQASVARSPDLSEVRIEQLLFKLTESDFTNVWLGMPSNGEAELLDRIFSQSPDVVAFSCYPWNIQLFNRLTASVRSCRPTLPMIYGGPIVAHGQAVTKAVTNPTVDYIVEGEGEWAFVELLRALQGCDAERARAVPGVHALEDGDYRYAGPPFDILDLGDTVSPVLNLHPKQTDWLSLETYRGCHLSCAYCNWGSDGRVRFYPLDRVKDELAYMLDRKVARIDFLDAIFNIKPKRADAILQFIVENYNRASRFSFEVFLEGLAELTMDLLGELAALGGVNLCEIGLQATDPQVSQLVQRPYNPARFWTKYSQLRSRAPQLEITLDIISGLPGDTLDGLLDSYDAALTAWPDYLNLFPCAIMPGATLEERVDSLGITLGTNPPYHVIGTPTLPADILTKFMVFERLFNHIFKKLRWSLRLAILSLGTEQVPARVLWDQASAYWQAVGQSDDKSAFADHLFSNIIGELEADESKAHWASPLQALFRYEMTLLELQESARRNKFALNGQQQSVPIGENGSDVIASNKHFSTAVFAHDLMQLIAVLKTGGNKVEHVLEPKDSVVGFLQQRQNQKSTIISVFRVPAEIINLCEAFQPPRDRDCAWGWARKHGLTEIDRQTFDAYVNASLDCGALIYTEKMRN